MCVFLSFNQVVCFNSNKIAGFISNKLFTGAMMLSSELSNLLLELSSYVGMVVVNMLSTDVVELTCHRETYRYIAIHRHLLIGHIAKRRHPTQTGLIYLSSLLGSYRSSAPEKDFQ